MVRVQTWEARIPELGPPWPEWSEIPGSGQIWPKSRESGQIWPNLAKKSGNLAKSGPQKSGNLTKSREIGQKSGNRPKSGKSAKIREIGQNPGFSGIFPKYVSPNTPKYQKSGQNRRKVARKVARNPGKVARNPRKHQILALNSRGRLRGRFFSKARKVGKVVKSWSKVTPKVQKKPKNTALYRGGHRIKESRGNTAVIRRSVELRVW